MLPCPRLWPIDRQRQIYREPCATADFALHVYRTAKAFHYSIDDREPEAGALFGWLGRKKWLEQVTLEIGRDTVAGVGYAEAAVGPGHDAECGRKRFAHCDHAHLDGSGSTVRHRIAGVDDEVEHDLIYRSLIRAYVDRTSGRSHANGDLVEDKAPQHRLHVPDDLG